METVYKEIIATRKETERVYTVIVDLIENVNFDLDMITRYCKRSIELNAEQIGEYQNKLNVAQALNASQYQERKNVLNKDKQE